MSITGLIGYPLGHSRSPVIHDYWLKKYNIESEYKLFTTQPARLRQTMLHMRKKNVKGVNITVPHKQAVMEYLDAADAVATAVGAVNTVINQNGKFTGSNTDAYGFITNLREHVEALPPFLQQVVVLGAGGAARAVLYALKEAGAEEIFLLNRTEDTAEKLAEEFGAIAAPWDDRNVAISEATLLVNTTSLGMEGQPPLDIDLELLPEDALVHDIVYAPLETRLLEEARLRGNPTVDGLGMLIYQAQKSFELWHGVLPEVTDELRDLVEAA